jgi:hypothetical protein
VKSWTWSDVGHTGLDVLGFVPGLGEAADVANAAWYVSEAKYLDAGLSLVSVIPVVGDVIGKGGKLAKRLGGDAAQKLLQALERVDVVKFLEQFKGHPKLGPYVAQIQEAVAKWVDELRGGKAQGAVPAPTTVPASIPRNAHLAGKKHPKTGVPFDLDGYPDFKAAGVVTAEVKITPTGSRAGDFRTANGAAGLDRTPEGYTWHHHQDGTTMQLVPRQIHADTGHTGGFAQTRAQ